MLQRWVSLLAPDTPDPFGSPILNKAPRRRNHVLLHLLGDPIPLHAGFPAEDPVVIPRQSDHRPTFLARITHLGVRESPRIQGSFHSTRQRDGERLFLGIFVGVERGAWVYATLSVNIPDFTVGIEFRTLRDFPGC